MTYHRAKIEASSAQKTSGRGLSANVDSMQRVLNIIVGELTEKSYALEAMVLTLKEYIKELKGELNICKVALGNRVLATAPKPKVDVPKSKEFNGTRSVKDVDNFFWGMEQ